MLEKLNLAKKINKKEYKKRMPMLRKRLYRLQNATWDANIPVIILFEGWDAGGKSSTIQMMASHLDPRGFKIHPTRAPRTYENKRPWLWRFWQKIPSKERWAIFDQSWYRRVLIERVEGHVPEAEWRRAYQDVVDFERTLSDDGTLILKFFLHISKEAQADRFQKLLEDPLTAWLVQPKEWEQHKKYDEYLLAIEEMLEKTDTEWGLWHIIEATDKRYTRVRIFELLIKNIESALIARGFPLSPPVDQTSATPTSPEDDDHSEELSEKEENTLANQIVNGPMAERN
jgi:polyphosphate kinase 2 (PPK2 family)